jgi:16S rRNA (guanine527-N7)-methyltransferase
LEAVCAVHDAAAALPALTVLATWLAKPEAPTSVHAPTDVVDVHVADSLVGLELRELRDAELIFDLGSGAGLPGLALAACLPRARVALVEASRKKCDFITAVADAMPLTNADPVWTRAEAWADGLGRADVVVARAVAPLAVIAEYAAPLLREGGAVVAWKGALEPAEVRDAAAAADILGLSPPRAIAVQPFAASERRTLQVLTKLRPTPDRFPRREGMAAKRPLSATTSP